ncbi:gastrin-releasing peptide receptor [Saccoglossus kowalevskii]|uniref:Bombesin receptor subtype-3 n=2 Tax=Saccoglossus kowalevskii TaxID=10224 RepID=A0ABM0GJ71_SACKO|nr:PREDICTED: bombesin receptor subtype-3 [Saccoglossus kowalevskii]
MTQNYVPDLPFANMTRDGEGLGITYVNGSQQFCCDWNVTFNDTYEYEYFFEGLGVESIIIPAIFALIFFVGVIGNGTLVRIVLCNPPMRSVPNIFIASLAMGDLLLLFVFVPFNAITYMTTSWPLGEGMCKVINCVQVASTGVSVFTLTALSADRYHAIVNPINKKATDMMQRTYTVAILIWLFAIALGIPTLVLATVVPFYFPNNSTVYYCQAIPMYMTLVTKGHTAAMAIVLYLVPLSIISVYYVLIAIKLIQSSKHLIGENRRNDTKQLKARKRLAKVVLVFVLIFGICWLPHHLFNIMLVFSPDTTYMQTYGMMFFKFLGTVMAYANSCVNPLALYFLSNTFKTYYKKYILCCFKSKHRKKMMARKYREHTNMRYSSSRDMVSRTTQRTIIYSV